MGKTSIAWTDESSNPLKVRRISDGKPGWYCRKLSPGCTHCYASTMNERGGTNPGRHGTGHAFKLSEAQHLEPYLNERELDKIARARKPRRWFVCDMTDIALSVFVCSLCGIAIEDGDLAAEGGLFAGCPNCKVDRRTMSLRFWNPWKVGKCLDAFYQAAIRGQTIQILTKRPARLKAELERWYAANPLAQNPVPGWWIGVSAEDQKRWDERVSQLVKIPAAVRFVSAEPLLAQIDAHGVRKLDLVIPGGESGPGARPCRLEWIDSLVAACRDAGTNIFTKQIGSQPLDHEGRGAVWMKDRKGGNPDEWPGGLNRFPREMP